MCVKGFTDCLSHDLHRDIDHDVSATTASLHQAFKVDLLSRTISTTMVVRDWCITILAHGWWVLIQSIVAIIRGGNCSHSSAWW